MSLASLGLGPYLTTGIVFQPLVLQAKNFGFTKFEEWRESGNVGRAKLELLTRSCAVLVAFIMAYVLVLPIAQSQASQAATARLFMPGCLINLVAGAALHIFVADNLHEHGITDGSSLIIGLSITSGYVALMSRSWPLLWGGSPAWFLPVVAATYVLFALLAVVLNRTELRVPLVHYREREDGASSQPNASVDAKGSSDIRLTGGIVLSSSGKTSELPVRVCPGGMMPILWGNGALAVISGPLKGVLAGWSPAAQHRIFCCLMFAFVAGLQILIQKLSETPKNMAKTLLQMDAGLRGVPPGDETEKHLKVLDKKLTVIGSSLMGMLAVAAYAFDAWCIQRIGMELGTNNVLLMCSLAASSISQVTSLWQEVVMRQQAARERSALRLL